MKKSKIYQKRKELNLTLEDVAKKVGVGASTVRKWENGDIKNIRQPNIVKLANTLGLSVIEVLGFDEEEQKKEQQHVEVNVPIIERIKNKSSILSKDNIKDYRVILKHNVPTGTIFIFTQTNDDLKPNILKDDDLLIRVEDEVKLNSIVAVLDDEDILLRRVRKVGSMIFLTTNNEDVEPILYDENVKVIGTAIEVIRHFE